MITVQHHDQPYHTDMTAFIEDRRNFAGLFQQYYEPLYHFALGLIASPQLAEEVVSDVFIKIWKNRADFAIKTSLQAYLFTAVRHQSIDYLRKSSRQRYRSDEIQPDYPSDYQTPEEGVINNEFEQRFEAAIAALPPQGQKVFRLSREEGMKYHEIAAHLNLSVKTVETHMGRSLRYLRKVLQDQDTP
ncbi:MAG TPA: RNA polymerase sigma-70 factor [Saprospiraceae bacterium]|nr:RNA polymerase sigma-70 factor [Saprospiraceae bacterium]HMP25251.1 RNA polymerase sigma-70 factor [Saprospiraceae bacterium]